MRCDLLRLYIEASKIFTPFNDYQIHAQRKYTYKSNLILQVWVTVQFTVNVKFTLFFELERIRFIFKMVSV